MRIFSRRFLFNGLVACAVLALASCGEQRRQSTPTAPAAPAGPTQARVTVTAASPVCSQLTPERLPGLLRIAVSSTIAESAGLGGNIDFRPDRSMPTEWRSSDRRSAPPTSSSRRAPTGSTPSSTRTLN